MKKILLLSLLAIFASITYSTIRNVPGSYSTIQSAILACSNGDSILVEPGTYFENINFRGRKIVLTSRYYLNNDPSIINTTIINGSTPLQPDSGSCVIFNNGEDSTTVLQGFTITGGSGTKWNDEHSAGLYREGGGILIQYSSPIIQNNIILNNQVTNLIGVNSTGGGGMRIGDSYPRIYNNVIMNNTARYGAGIVLNYSGCIMKNNVICLNYGSFQYGAGAGIWINNNFTKPKLIENNTIVNNTSISGTGGVHLVNSSEVGTMRNCIIWGNTNAQFSGTGFTITYSDIQQSGIPGTGNLNLNPQFSDTSFILTSTSPCVDAGDSSIAYNDPQDSLNPGYAKYPSRGSIRNDMGAYGGQMRKILSSTLIGIKKIDENVPSGFILYQNFPNPFNPTTKIDFNIPYVQTGEIKLVQLKIYNILGEEKAILIDKILAPGQYSITWNASSSPSGVYFYRLIFGDLTLTKKMILLK